MKTVKVQIIGEAGSGKSTIAYIIGRALDHQQIYNSTKDNDGSQYPPPDNFLVERISHIQTQTNVEIETVQSPRDSMTKWNKYPIVVDFKELNEWTRLTKIVDEVGYQTIYQKDGELYSIDYHIVPTPCDACFSNKPEENMYKISKVYRRVEMEEKVYYDPA